MRVRLLLYCGIFCPSPANLSLRPLSPFPVAFDTYSCLMLSCPPPTLLQDGQTAMDVAQKGGHAAIVALLQ